MSTKCLEDKVKLLEAIIEKMECWIDDTDWTPCKYCPTFTPCPNVQGRESLHCINEGGCETTAFEMAKIIVEKEKKS